MSTTDSMHFRDRAKLFGFMLLAKFSNPARALAALAMAAIAAACGGSTPGPGPQPTEVKVSAVSPNSGTTFGGTTLTITGTGFQSGATVQIGGTAATDVTVTNSTTITAKTPAHAAGVAEVRVTVGSKSGTLASAFTFVKATTAPNSAPVVSPLSVQPPRVNQPITLATIGDRISLTASVNDAETPANELTYEWTANPSLGAFSGTGAAVQWIAPETVTSSQLVMLILTVVERYQEADSQGLPVQREHRVQQAVVLKVHDSVKEIGDMARDFLTRFSNSALGHEAVLHNFSRNCDDGEGYLQELQDVLDHRRDYTMLSYDIGPASVTFAYGARPTACAWPGAPGDACAKVPVVWKDKRKDTGAENTVTGNDYVSAVYESSRWYLCHSKWQPLSSTSFHAFFNRIK